MNPTNAEFLDDLALWAQTQGVSLATMELDCNTWAIDSLVREEDSPKGTGRVVLFRLTEEADARQATVLLGIPPENQALAAWYASFGFTDAPASLFIPSHARILQRLPAAPHAPRHMPTGPDIPPA